MSTLKNVARDCLPPALVRWLRHVRGLGISFEGDFATWEEAKTRSTGYDTDEILASVLAATLKVKHGEAAFERDSVVFIEIDYVWPVLAGLMWAAARSGGRLNVLDFGGALGSAYFQNKKFLQTLSQVKWNVVEQPHYVEAGQKHLQDERLCFYKTIESCLAENQPNVILLSSVLQYLESPYDIVDQLNKVGATCLVVDRTPFSGLKDDKLTIQHVPSSIYKASYPMWIFSRLRFEQKLVARWNVVATNLSMEGRIRTNKSVDLSFEGLLLESRQ